MRPAADVKSDSDAVFDAVAFALRAFAVIALDVMVFDVIGPPIISLVELVPEPFRHPMWPFNQLLIWK